MEEENKNWAPPQLKEAPFWHEGMSVEEYDREREYLNTHLADLYNGTYQPLWKQKSY